MNNVINVLPYENNYGAGKVVEASLPHLTAKQYAASLCYIVNDVKDLRNVYRYVPIELFKTIVNCCVNGMTIIHGHLTPSLFWMTILSVFAPKQFILIYTEHSPQNRRSETRYGKYIDKLLYGTITCVVAISPSVKSALISRKAKSANSIACFYNPVELSLYRVIASENLKLNSRKLLFVGRLDEVKNVSRLIYAFRESLSIYDDLHLTIVGDGVLRNHLEHLVTSLKLDNCIYFAGFQQDTRFYMESSGVMIIPSLWEGFGLVAVEGMATGLGIVCSDVRGLSDVVGPIRAGVAKIDPQSVEDIGRGIIKVIADIENGYSISHQNYIAQYDASKHATALDNLYASLFRVTVI